MHWQLACQAATGSRRIANCSDTAALAPTLCLYGSRQPNSCGVRPTQRNRRRSVTTSSSRYTSNLCLASSGAGKRPTGGGENRGESGSCPPSRGRGTLAQYCDIGESTTSSSWIICTCSSRTHTLVALFDTTSDSPLRTGLSIWNTQPPRHHPPFTPFAHTIHRHLRHPSASSVRPSVR